MFLLFLIVLGTASVKAQVRIGGNTVPNGAAVLDLNASDGVNMNAATAVPGTKGLALPRVSLTSNTMQIASGVTQVTGMLVYNTNNTFLPVGIYTWTGTGGIWKRVDAAPAASPADSGLFLRSNGSSAQWAVLFGAAGRLTDSVLTTRLQPVTMQLSIDTIIPVTVRENSEQNIIINGLSVTDFCNVSPNNGEFVLGPGNNILFMTHVGRFVGPASMNMRIRCIRPSL